MLSLLLKYAKKVLLILILVGMLLVSFTSISYSDYSENSNRPVDIVVRVGEWGNEQQVKPGKRYTWGRDINISQHGLNAKDIPTDIPLRCENNEWFISEFDINLKLAKAIAMKLSDNYGVDVNLQYATNASGDLNSAGRIANQNNPKIYLSVHHNSFKDDTTGYFFMSNRGDVQSSIFAKELSDSFANNGLIPQRSNRANDGYIGELNTVNKEGRISILGEFGYFNKAELLKIVSNEYVNYVSDQVAYSLYNQLNEMNKSSEITKDDEVFNISTTNEVVTITFK